MGPINTLDSRYGEGTAARGHVTSVSPRGAKKARPEAAVRRTTPQEAIRPERCEKKMLRLNPRLSSKAGSARVQGRTEERQGEGGPREYLSSLDLCRGWRGCSGGVFALCLLRISKGPEFLDSLMRLVRQCRSKVTQAVAEEGCSFPRDCKQVVTSHPRTK